MGLIERTSAMRSLLWVWIFAVAGCVSEVEVLDSGGVFNDGGTLPGPSIEGSGALWTGCREALFEGRPRDRCSFEAAGRCEYAAGCCTESAACFAGTLELARDCSRCPACRSDADCPSGESFCVTGVCAPCDAQTPRCEDAWQLSARNGCYQCVPSNQCTSDDDCPTLERCYAGRLCLPGCMDDPRCCFGNLCAAAGCFTPSELDSTSELDCAVVGCREPERCRISHGAVSCSCTAGVWQCSHESANVCAAF